MARRKEALQYSPQGRFRTSDAKCKKVGLFVLWLLNFFFLAFRRRSPAPVASGKERRKRKSENRLSVLALLRVHQEEEIQTPNIPSVGPAVERENTDLHKHAWLLHSLSSVFCFSLLSLVVFS